MSAKGFSHVALSVRDAARSARFYSEVFGFEPGSRHDLGAVEVVDRPPLPVICQFIRLGEMQLALLEYASHEAQDVPRPMHRLGIANIAFHVGALDPVMAKVESSGGTVHRESLLDSDQGRFVHCSDPDGVRIELMCLR